MAAPADPERTPLTPLKGIAHTLGDLPEIAAEWERLSVDERLSWSLDWGNEMSKLEDLARPVAAGSLSSAELARYQSLLRKLSTAMPIIAQLGLRCPSVPLHV